MSFQTIQERLLTLQETTRQITELISRLANLKFQPGSVPLDLDDEEDNVTSELSNEIHQSLKETEEDLEVLEQEVRDLAEGRKGGKEEQHKKELAENVRKAEGETKTLRSAFRKAQLVARANLSSAQRAERALLLSSLANPSASTDSLPLPSRRKNMNASQELSKEDKTVAAASDVTLALRRTHTLMASELSRSQFAHDTLKESTLALKELGETYSVLDTLLSKSRTLVGTLLNSQKSDTWYLESAFYLLAVTIGWLIFRRFIYGPAWWLVWLPLKMFYKAWMGVFVAVGLRGNREGVFATESVGSISSVYDGPVGTVSPSVVESDIPTMRGTGNEPTVKEEDNMIEEVGNIIDESQQEKDDYSVEKTVEKLAKNPKKRMWEETEEVKKEERRRKNEL